MLPDVNNYFSELFSLNTAKELPPGQLHIDSNQQALQTDAVGSWKTTVA